jgi:hypothetical protein
MKINIIIFALMIVLASSISYGDCDFGGTQFFTGFTNYYSRIITCPSTIGNQYATFEGLLSYSVGTKETPPSNLKSCGTDDLFITNGFRYGSDGSDCDNSDDEVWTGNYKSGCSIDSIMMPFYIVSCQVYCDLANGKIDYKEVYPITEEFVDCTNANGVFSDCNYAARTTGGGFQSTDFKYKCTYPDSYVGKNITIRLGCTLKMSAYYTYPQYVPLSHSYHDTRSFLDYTNNFLGGDVIQDSALRNYMNYMLGDKTCDIDRTYSQRNNIKTGTLIAYEKGLYFQDFHDTNIYINSTNSTSELPIVIKTNSSNPYEGDTNSPSPNGGGTGDPSQESDGNQAGKQISYAIQVQNILHQQSFILSFLGLTQTIFACIVLLFYILEIIIFIYVLFRWIPDLVNGILEMLKKIITGK